MKFKALLAATALFAVTPALAADLAPEPVEPAPVYMPFNWTGFYVGAQVGYGWGDSTSKSGALTGVDRDSIDPDGVFGGGYVGYNYQFGPDMPVVIGIEGDINYSGLKGDDARFADGTVEGKQKWNGAVRARLGYAFDRFLPYIAGGVAFGKYELDFDNVPGLGSASDTLTGWTIGGGLEYAFTDNLVGRVEYRYTDYGDTDINYAGIRGSADLKTNDVRLGVSYKF